MKPTKQQNNQNKLRNKFLKAGVKMVGPETIFFSNDSKIGKGVTIEPYVVIGSKVKIGNNVVIKSFSHLESCKVENKVEIGPYARIRPDTILKEGSKVGNFVEIKKSTVGNKSKINAGIKDSYLHDTENFFFYNNGISAVARKIKEDEEEGILYCSEFSVVNGAQTFSTLAKTYNELSQDSKNSKKYNYGF